MSRNAQDRLGVPVQGFLWSDALRVAAELSASGNVVARFVYGTRANVPDAMIKGGKVYRILTDHLGSPRPVVDSATGTVVQRMDDDALGRVMGHEPRVARRDPARGPRRLATAPRRSAKPRAPMGIWTWLFPSDDDRLLRAKKRMAQGKWADARKDLMHCSAPEAEGLYDECSRHIDKGDEATLKKRLKSEGFHGWKVEVDMKNAKRRAELEGLITEELGRAGVDLDMPEIDEKVFKSAVTKAQRRVRSPGKETGAVRLVPVVEEKLARQMEQMQQQQRQAPQK